MDLTPLKDLVMIMNNYRAVDNKGFEISNNQIVDLLRYCDEYMSLQNIAESLDVEVTEKNLTKLREHCYHLGLKNTIIDNERCFRLDA